MSALLARDFNRLVREAARHQPLRGVRRAEGVRGEHHWLVRAAFDAQLGAWRVHVGAGAVNDQVAAVTYLRDGDPRGWEMPGDHPAIPLMRQLYGADFTFVDRSLLETADPPHLLALAPSADDADRGDFELVPPASRPEAFRTRAMWERELYRARVWVTAAPLRASRVADRLGFPIPTRNRRFRVYLGAKLPVIAATVQAGGHKELARLYLARVPGDPSADTITVHQRAFWSFWQLNAEPTLNLGESLFGFGEIADILAQIILGVVAGDLESAASVNFWSV